jgi:NADH-quinone oxidoreductase subunit L
MDPKLPWFILANPLVAAALIQLLLRRNHSAASALSVLSAFAGLLAALGIWFSAAPASALQIPWIDFGSQLQIPIGLLIDPLSKLMLLVVTGVGALVHLYSLVYMAGDDSKGRFFGNLSLFMFSMLGIVLADNFAMMFIFWELVGVSSYLLIGHWFTKNSAAAAANKAFLTNRIGDFGFMLGILILWTASGTVVFPELAAKASSLPIAPGLLTAGVLLVFCGAVGKSAQLPLHVWLPDAMEGPTPVSALIHAATMVAAGVYMLARVSFLITLSPDAQSVIAWTGILTAVFAALLATQQDDIKRILAYSTLSQLGYMVSAIGLAAPGAAMFHLFTHAFFKALLFLGAGAVIHALHHEQDIWRMGGLAKKMPLTFMTFATGYLALIGCPGLSGFFSKDLILMAAWQHNKVIFALGVATAGLTAFYMTRLFVVAFLGTPRSEAAAHGHDGPAAMTLPLLLLAIPSISAGWPLIQHAALGHETSEALHHLHESGSSLVVIFATLAFAVGTGVSFFIYGKAATDPIRIGPLRNKLYIDEVYSALISATQDLAADMSAWFDKWILDGVMVRGLSGATWGLGFALRFLQVGNLQAYSFIFGLGVVTVIYLLILR